MIRYLMITCLLVGFSIDCSLVRGQVVAHKTDVPGPVPHELLPGSSYITEPVGEIQSPPLVLNMSPGSLGDAGVLTHPATLTGPETAIASASDLPSLHQLPHHPQAMHSGGKVGQLPMSFSLHRAGDNLHCPLKLLHVPYGAWIEIEGAWYQHKSLNNTTDVCVNFEITPSSFQPSVVIRTASSPGEIRQSESSMSKSILLVPGQTVEFDYAREFGEQLRKNPSKSERDRVGRMSHAGFDSDGHARMVSAPIIANQTPQADQLSSIQPVITLPNITLTANSSSQWDVAPASGSLFSLQAGARMLSSLAPNIRLKADMNVVYLDTERKVEVHKPFPKTQIEGELGGGRLLGTSPDKAEIACTFNFCSLFNGSSDFAKYVGSATKSGPIECSFTNVKLEFYNNRFDKESTAAVDGLLISPFTLKLNLTTR